MNSLAGGGDGSPSVCVVGAGTRFLSGITYVTYGMANELSAHTRTSALLVRNLLPAVLYPGRSRVGSELTGLDLSDQVAAYDGVDWSWGSSMVGAIAFLRRERPEIVHFHWWSGTTLHSYLLLAMVARLLGAKISIELHEVLDTGEDDMALVAAYVNRVAPKLFSKADALVVHSDFDRRLAAERFGLAPDRFTVVAHPEMTHFQTAAGDGAGTRPERSTHRSTINYLYFGVIRPFKGVDDLAAALELLAPVAGTDVHLTIAGECWEGTQPMIDAIRTGPGRDRITIIDRYITDTEVDDLFRVADVVVLPYHRSSQSGPLHVAMGYGLPIVVTDVGGLTEAVSDYPGAVLCRPEDPADLACAMQRAIPLVGTSYETPRTWDRTTEQYLILFRGLLDEQSEAPVRYLVSV